MNTITFIMTGGGSIMTSMQIFAAIDVTPIEKLTSTFEFENKQTKITITSNGVKVIKNIAASLDKLNIPYEANICSTV